MYPHNPIDTWSLREKAHKCWENLTSNILVYLGKFPDTNDETINSAAEEYIKGGCWCELHLCLNRNGHSHYVAIIESALKRGDNTFRNFELNACSLGGNNPMLVDIAKFIKNPEGVGLVACPSVIWLKRLDFINSGRGDILRDVVKCPHFFRGIFINDREGGSLIGSTSDCKSHLPSDVVKNGSEIVYGITCNNGESGVNGGYLTPQDIESILSIFFCGDTRGFCIKELSNFNVQNIEVFFRPFEPQLRVFETRNHMLYYPYGEECEKDTKNTEGIRDSCTIQERVCRQSQESIQTLSS